MVTCDERRRVAERLRSLEVPARVKRKEHPEKTAAWYELICGAVGGKKDPWFGVEALADRLADLIEPPACPARVGRAYAEDIDWNTGESPLVHELRDIADRMGRECAPVDREALLALADEFDAEYAERSREMGFPELADGGTAVSRRIREACGEVEDRKGATGR